MSEQYENQDLLLPSSASSASGWSNTQTYVTVGIVAAAVSAAVAYAVWSRHQARHEESVQELLDEAHDKVRSIEKRLGDIRASVMTDATTEPFSA